MKEKDYLDLLEKRKIQVNDLHTHFHCEECNKTFCFQNIPTPVVQVPEGFTLSSINYVLKGLCPECAAKATPKE